jgi:hypothetical protein
VVVLALHPRRAFGARELGRDAAEPAVFVHGRIATGCRGPRGDSRCTSGDDKDKSSVPEQGGPLAPAQGRYRASPQPRDSTDDAGRRSPRDFPPRAGQVLSGHLPNNETR